MRKRRLKALEIRERAAAKRALHKAGVWDELVVARSTPNPACIREFCRKLVDPNRYYEIVDLNELSNEYKTKIIIDKLPFKISPNTPWARRYSNNLSTGVLSTEVKASPFLSNRGLLLRPYFIEQVAEQVIRDRSQYFRSVFFAILRQEYDEFESLNWRALRFVFNNNPS